MKIELLGTIKGVNREGKIETWQKGKIFDDTVEAIPSDILLAFSKESPKVRAVVDVKDMRTQVISDKQLQGTLEDLEKARAEINELKNKVLLLEKEKADLQKEVKSLKHAAIEADPVEIATAETEAETEEKTEPAKFVCKKCGRDDFSSQNDLDEHMKKVHKGK